MPEDKNYTREAFFNGYNIAFLVATSLLGALNPELLPLIAGIGLPLEGLYLLTVPGQGWFQRWVNLQKEIDKEEAVEKQKVLLLKSLPSSVRERFERLRKMKEEISRKCSEKGQICSLSPEDLLKLDNYLEAFLFFLRFKAQCLACKNDIDQAALQQNIQRLKRAIEQDRQRPDRQKVNKLREENIKLTQEMLERVQRLDGYIEMVDAQMDAIENTLKVIQVRMVTAGFQAEGEVEIVSTDLNHLLEGIRDTEKSVEEASRDMVKLRKLSRLDVRRPPTM